MNFSWSLTAWTWLILCVWNALVASMAWSSSYRRRQIRRHCASARNLTGLDSGSGSARYTLPPPLSRDRPAADSA